MSDTNKPNELLFGEVINWNTKNVLLTKYSKYIHNRILGLYGNYT